jgi:uncharacterized protein with HEPN domain
MKREYIDYLNDILDETKRISKFLKGVKYIDFQDNYEKIYAVCRSFEIIGEAAKCLPDRIIKENPNIPWSEMARMRDRLIHYYYGADTKTLWKTSKKDIPILQEQIIDVIEKEKLV